MAASTCGVKPPSGRRLRRSDGEPRRGRASRTPVAGRLLADQFPTGQMGETLRIDASARWKTPHDGREHAAELAAVEARFDAAAATAVKPAAPKPDTVAVTSGN